MDSASASASLGSADDRLPNILVTAQDLDAMLTYLQELNSDRAYQGSDLFSIPSSEEPYNVAYAQKGYDVCMEDVSAI